MKRFTFILCLLFPFLLFSSQQLQLNSFTGNSSNTYPNSNPYNNLTNFRVETNFSVGPFNAGEGVYTNVFSIGGLVTFRTVLLSGVPTLAAFLPGCGSATNNVAISNRSDFLVRAQYTRLDGSWNVELVDRGSQQNYQLSSGAASCPNPINVSGNGVSLSSSSPAPLSGLRVGFIKWYSTLVPLNSRPPQKYDHGDLLDLNFDGNLTDNVGVMNITWGGTGASYVGYPVYNPYAQPKTYNAPTWSDWTSLRAGNQGRLDGTNSYSQGNFETLLYNWNQIYTGSPTLFFSNKNVSTPYLNGLQFGTFNVALKVTDTEGNSTISTLRFGSASCDNKGIVVPADNNVRTLFGDMVCFGSNPWSWGDRVQKNDGYFFGGLLGDVNDGYTYGQGTISVTNGSSTVNGVNTILRQVFCKNADTPQLSNYSRYYIYIYPSNGSRVRKQVTACPSNTQITLDSNWTGVSEANLHYQSAYFEPVWRDLQTGTVAVVNGNTTLTGTGTNFLTVFNNPAVRVVVRRPDATVPSGYRYNVYLVNSCASDTVCTMGYAWQDASGSGYNWSIMIGDETDSRWGGLGTNVNYYDNGLAQRGFYYASGMDLYLNYHRVLTDDWLEDPVNDYYRENAYFSIISVPRTRAYMGVIARAILDNQTYLWPFLRLVNNYDWNNPNGGLQDTRNIGDIREQGAILLNAAGLAKYDIDGANRATEVSRMNYAFQNIWVPQRQPNGNWIDNYQPQSWYSVTANVNNGNNLVTTSGTLFTPTGPGTVSTNIGDPQVVGSGTNFTSTWLGITLKIAGVLYKITSITDGTHVNVTPTPGVLNSGVGWNYTNACSNYLLNTSNFPSKIYFGINQTDRASWDTTAYNCTLTGETTLTLDRNYEGSSGAAKYFSYSIYAGDGTQPFMMGYVGNAINTVAQVYSDNGDITNSNLAKSYNVGIGDWLANGSVGGYRSSAFGLYYKVQGYGDECYPNPNLYPQCTDGGDGPGASREFAMETWGAMTWAINAGAGIGTQNIASIFAGNNLGYPGYGGPDTSNGNWAGSIYDAPGYIPVSKNAKYYGFPWGNGYGRALPGALLGGLSPAQPTSLSIKWFKPGYVTTANFVAVQPNGLRLPGVDCNSSPCVLNNVGDLRQGSEMWIDYNYKDGGGSVIRSGHILVPVQ